MFKQILNIPKKMEYSIFFGIFKIRSHLLISNPIQSNPNFFKATLCLPGGMHEAIESELIQGDPLIPPILFQNVVVIVFFYVFAGGLCPNHLR